jgi:hypothetical protein
MRLVRERTVLSRNLGGRRALYTGGIKEAIDA